MWDTSMKTYIIPTPNFRFYKRKVPNHPGDYSTTLQQYWQEVRRTWYSFSGTGRGEWKEVPTVVEE
jgi:hypothetical protein